MGLPSFALRVRNAEVGSSSLLPSTSFFLTLVFHSANVLPIGQDKRLQRVDLPGVRRMGLPHEYSNRLMARQCHDGEIVCPAGDS